MTSLSEEILGNYQIRKTAKQKLRFIELLKSNFTEMTVQEGGFPKNRNIILGNIDDAKVVLTAHYDTCAWLPFPNLITPKNIFASILYSIAIILPFILIGIGINYILALFINNFIVNYIVSLMLYFIVIYMMLAGPANKHTANDNTSGVLTLCEIYQAMSSQQKAHTAIVFFDNEELGLLGSSFFRSIYKNQMKDKLLINYDCVSDGDHILIGVSKKARPSYQELFERSFLATDNKNILIEKAEKLIYPSDQSNFKCTAAIAALNKNKIFGYYMSRIHTNRDTVFDEENITILKNYTLSLIDQL